MRLTDGFPLRVRFWNFEAEPEDVRYAVDVVELLAEWGFVSGQMEVFLPTTQKGPQEPA